MSPVRPRSPAPNMSCLRYTSPTIHQGRRWPTGARYPSGKGEVCKTFMRRFDPDPRLHHFNKLAMWFGSDGPCHKVESHSEIALLTQILELHIQDRVTRPILVIEMPPLGRVDRKTLCHHNLPQQCAESAFISRSAGEIGISPSGHLVITTRHLHFFPRLQVIQRHINRAPTIVS